jgi:hypothetical protein
MSEEQRKNPANISREELYRQVWATPMSRLGTQYGISGNGLKKICVRLNVPYPPRGYWAKLAAAKAVRQTPLPKPLAGTLLQVTIIPTPPPAADGYAPELEPDTAERLREASTKTSGITVPATLRRPHRAIADWITRHQREIADAKRDRSRYGFALQPKHFSSLERRRQRFLSTLFKEAEKLGYKVRGEAPHNLSLETGHNEVEFTLRERIKQVRRPLTDEEKARYSSTRNWRQEKVATGELVFTLKTYLGAGLPDEWHDGERGLEEQIGDRRSSAAVGRRRKGAARNARDRIRTAIGGGGSLNLPGCGKRRGWPGISSMSSRSALSIPRRPMKVGQPRNGCPGHGSDVTFSIPATGEARTYGPISLPSQPGIIAKAIDKIVVGGARLGPRQ